MGNDEAQEDFKIIGEKKIPITHNQIETGAGTNVLASVAQFQWNYKLNSER